MRAWCLVLAVVSLHALAAKAEARKCQLIESGSGFAPGSYVEFSPTGPELTLYAARTRADGTLQFRQTPLITKSKISSYRVSRDNTGCTVERTVDNFLFNCQKLESGKQDLRGFLIIGNDRASGTYWESLFSGAGTTEMRLEFFDCK